MGTGKRRVVLAALILTLGLAVYLNWQFGAGGNELTATGSLNPTKNLGDTKLVSGTTEKKNTNTSYFGEARQNRQKARDEALDILKDIMNDVKSDNAMKSDAITKAAEIAKRVDDEANIENLVKAKGFSDCVAILSENEANIVVATGELLPSELITIKDIVMSQTKLPAEKIKIVPVK